VDEVKLMQPCLAECRNARQLCLDHGATRHVTVLGITVAATVPFCPHPACCR